MSEVRASLSAKLPRRIARLEELAYNFWWSWHRAARDLFKMLDYPLWHSTSHNPVQMLLEVSPERLEELATSPLFLRQYDAVMMALESDLGNGHLWFPGEHSDLLDRPVAYFSAEFGLHRSLPIYSGGLGVLAGDHCKEASDIGLPFVAVGFLYEMGYFRQRVNADGWQEAIYPHFKPDEVAISEAVGDDGKTLFVPVEINDQIVDLQLWHVHVGRTQLYLMDADNEHNAPWERELTRRLYGGDQEMRIQQEIVLGIGGLRVLRALGIKPLVFHLNEGHTAFLVLERAKELVKAGYSFEEAREIVGKTSVFTTHTPVPAGHDVFHFHLMEKYFHNYWPSLSLSREQFLGLGRHEEGQRSGFNMTALALRMCNRRNSVSKLHGEVSRRMWHSFWPDKEEEDVPITHITNGIHVPAWVGGAMNRIYRKYLGPDWIERHDEPALWERILEVPDEELWEAHIHLKNKLMALMRERARRRRIKGLITPEQVLCAGTLLDPDALVIGFARRFATYKRATLIFRDLERLKRLLHDRYRPVQFIFAGKAHPADDPGKRLLQQIYNIAKDPAIGGRIAFIEDYDLQVARYLVQGVDVWLNTPRRPHEASGTSGQKAAANGIPNLSVLDGWWAEGYNGANGWAIDPQQSGDLAAQDDADAETLYNLLENEVVPLFYKRDPDDVPREWVRVMKEAIRTAVPVFCTRRMLKEYTEHLYVPAARQANDIE
jgi:glycogen phosphorylase